MDGTGGAVEAIGLAAWAHHEGMLPSAPTLLPRCDDSALSRTARLLPSVGGKPTAEVVRQLELLWNAKESTAVRVAVLHALARVALHDPDASVDTLGRLAAPGLRARLGVRLDARPDARGGASSRAAGKFLRRVVRAAYA